MLTISVSYEIASFPFPYWISYLNISSDPGKNRVYLQGNTLTQGAYCPDIHPTTHQPFWETIYRHIEKAFLVLQLSSLCTAIQQRHTRYQDSATCLSALMTSSKWVSQQSPRQSQASPAPRPFGRDFGCISSEEYQILVFWNALLGHGVHSYWQQGDQQALGHQKRPFGNTGTSQIVWELGTIRSHPDVSEEID